MKVAIARCVDCNVTGTVRIWVPPTGKPYWVITGKPNAGPDLTDNEIEQLKAGITPKYRREYNENC